MSVARAALLAAGRALDITHTDDGMLLHLLALASSPQAASPPAPRVVLARSVPGAQNDVGVSIAAQGDGFVVGGYTSKDGVEDEALLLALDRDGNERWRRTLPSRGDGALWRVRALDGDGFVCAGWERSERGDTDALLVAVEENGAPRWMQRFGDARKERLWALDLLADGFLCVGEAQSDEGVESFVVRTDRDGRELARHVFASAKIERMFDVVALADGGFVVAGMALKPETGALGYDARVVKCDAAGTVEWSRGFGGSVFDVAHALAATPDGGVVVAGYARVGGEERTAARLVQFSSAGEVAWSKTYDGAASEHVVALKRTPTGELALTGYAADEPGGEDLMLRVVDARGEPLFEQRFGGAERDMGRAIELVGARRIAVVGQSKSYGPHERVLLLELDLAPR